MGTILGLVANPPDMTLVEGEFEIVSKVKESEEVNFSGGTLNVETGKLVTIRLLKPEEMKGREYGVYSFPSDTSSRLYRSEIGQKFSYTTVKHALNEKRRKFHVSAFAFLKPLSETEGSIQSR